MSTVITDVCTVKTLHVQDSSIYKKYSQCSLTHRHLWGQHWMSILERWLPYRELKKTTKELQRQLVWGWRPSYRNVLFKQQVTYIRCTILDKSPRDSTAIFLFSCDPFFGVRGGVGHVWIGKCPRNAKMSQDFWLILILIYSIFTALVETKVSHIKHIHIYI